MFAVVQFSDKDGGSVSIIEKKWLTPRKCEVLWPPVKDQKALDKILKTHGSPDSSWKTYGIERIFYETDALEKAKQKLKLVEVTSDIQTDAEEDIDKRPKRKPHKTKRFVCSDNDDEDDTHQNVKYIRPPPLKKQFLQYIEQGSPTTSTSQAGAIKDQIAPPPSTPNKDKQLDLILSDTNITDYGNDVSIIDYNEYQNTDFQSDVNCPRNVSQLISDVETFMTTSTHKEQETAAHRNRVELAATGSYQEKVIALLSHLKNQNEQILGILQSKTTECLDSVFKIPIKILEDIKLMEESLLNKDKYTNLVAYISSLGGRDLANKVSRTLKALLTDSVACHFNYCGKRSDKKPFSELKLKTAVVDGVKSASHRGTTDREIEDIIKNWLKHAPERQKKHLIRTQQHHRQLLRRVREDKLNILSQIQIQDSSTPHIHYEPLSQVHELSSYKTVNSTLSNPLACTSTTTSIDYMIPTSYNTTNDDYNSGDLSLDGRLSIIQHIHLNDTDIASQPKHDLDLTTQLKHWATVQHKIPHNAVDSLLKILKPLSPTLPKDSRTLLKTPKHVETIPLDCGEFVYIGILHQLKIQLKILNHTKFKNRNVVISFNIDGLPLFKSKNTQLWPILVQIKDYASAKPFVIALFSGSTKPPIHMFFRNFVVEICELIEVGFDFEDVHYDIKVHSFICDAPARAFIKYTKSHGGYSSCDKCVEPGEYIHGRVIYKSLSAGKRTDEQFRLQSDEDHHLGETPLLNLPIDLVESFPIDYMHGVCLGVMRKLLNIWVGGDLTVRLCSRSVHKLTEKLLSCAKYIPIEFNRRPRAISELARWKATEFRMFLLYVGPVKLKNVLPIALYENYLLLHCAISILCSQKHIDKVGIDFAHELL